MYVHSILHLYLNCFQSVLVDEIQERSVENDLSFINYKLEIGVSCQNKKKNIKLFYYGFSNKTIYEYNIHIIDQVCKQSVNKVTLENIR